MKNFPIKLFFSLLAFTLLANAAAADDFFIRDGDRVVFLGDSITAQRLYTTYIEAYALTRFPQWKLTFRNVGWGGDTSWLRKRATLDEATLFAAKDAAQQKMVEASVGNGLRRDVLPLKPTVVTIDYGMNDHAYRAFDENIFRAYVHSETQLAKVLKANGARVALLTPQPIEHSEQHPYKPEAICNDSMLKFSDGLKKVAAENGALFVDQFDPYAALIAKARAATPPKSIGGGDAIHPGPQGQILMAWAILKGLGAPALVSLAELDAAAKRIVSSQRCKIDNLNFANGGVSFDRLDESLPMPIDSRAVDALKIAPVLDDLNRYELKISNLPAGHYALTIDGEAAATFTSEELAKGCNLANVSGPITKQAQQILHWVFEKNDAFSIRWSSIQLYDFPAWAKGAETEAKRAAELARLDQQIADMEAKIGAARKPKPHHFELKPVGK